MFDDQRRRCQVKWLPSGLQAISAQRDHGNTADIGGSDKQPGVGANTLLCSFSLLGPGAFWNQTRRQP